MSKVRMINTKFWTDSYVLDELNPVDKLLFLYLLTNPYTEICGIYELPLKVMAVETGIEKDNIEKVILPRFEAAGRILYRKGWVAIKNFIKHQHTNPSVSEGIKRGLSKAPKELVDFVGDSLYTVSPQSARNLNLNLNPNFNLNLNPNFISAAQNKNPKPKKKSTRKPRSIGDKTEKASLADIRAVVAYYFAKKGYTFDDGEIGKKRAAKDFPRNAAVASRLLVAGYTVVQINHGVDYCAERFDEMWTLETVEKRILDAVKVESEKKERKI